MGMGEDNRHWDGYGQGCGSIPYYQNFSIGTVSIQSISVLSTNSVNIVRRKVQVYDDIYYDLVQYVHVIICTMM